MTDILHDLSLQPTDGEVAAWEVQFEPETAELTNGLTLDGTHVPETAELPQEQLDRLEQARVRRQRRLGITSVDELLGEGKSETPAALSNEQLQMVSTHIGLAYSTANKFNLSRRSDIGEDLRQVAVIGLIKAIRKFNPALAPDGRLAPFAVSTMEGELKRFLRDTSWGIHVSRDAKELYVKVSRAINEGEASEDDIERIQKVTGLTEQQVRKGLDVKRVKGSVSIDGDPLRDIPPMEIPASNDPAHEASMNVVLESIERTDPRLAKIIELRVKGLSQFEIGKQVGLSQMQVGRLIKKAGVVYEAILRPAV